MEGFENFREIVSKAYPDRDFSTFIPDEEEEEGEEGQEGGDKGKEGEGATEGVVEETRDATPGEATLGDANP